MTEKERIKKVVQSIPYPVMVVGSGVMAMHDMDRKLGDLDLFMATQHWFDLYEDQDTWPYAPWQRIVVDPDNDHRFDPPYLERFIDGLKVNIFFAWRVRENSTDLDANQLWLEAELVEGVACSPIKHLLRWKQAVMREKDLPDIKAILTRYPELANQ